MDAQQRYKLQQEQLVWSYDDPLRGLLLRRMFLQEQIAQHQSRPGMSSDMERMRSQQRALEAQINAEPLGRQYMAKEAALAENYLEETGGFSAVGSPTPPRPAATSGPGPGYARAPRPRPGPSPRRPVPGYGDRNGAGHGTGYSHPVYTPYPSADGTGEFGFPYDGAETVVDPVGRRSGPRPARPPSRSLPPGYPPGTGPMPGQRPKAKRRGHPGPPDLVTGGRLVPPGVYPPAKRKRRGRKRWHAPVAAILLVVVAALLLTRVSGGGSGYPPSIGQVKQWITAACQDQNTAVPGAPQFACGDGKDALWVFSYMTSGANPSYVGPKPPQAGAQPRQGLMPVPLAQAQQYAVALRLPDGYHWDNPVDSLKVGALILNAFVYGTVEQPQAGLESNPSNCARYTGVAQTQTLSSGIVDCAQKLTDQGKLALIYDLYGKWATTVGVKVDQKLLGTAANAAEVLFANPNSPDNSAARSALSWVDSNHKQLLV